MLKILINFFGSILYFVIITPISIILKMFGVDYLDRKIDRNEKSYWKI